jgi:sugar O-acyltransferase (sialic acid O-acetyltransferase NeuD family)
MKRIGIFGLSGFAREVGDIVHELGYQPIYVARAQSEMEAWSFPDEVILDQDVDQHRSMDFCIGIGDNAVRERVATRFAGRLRFATVIHPSATFGRGQRSAVQERQGCVICAGVRFTNNISVGNFCIFNLNATVGHDVIADDFVNVAPGACISGNVHLGARCWVGTGAAINQGTSDDRLRIGADTVVGSGSVVTKSCESNAVYVGAPAKRIK